ncbi:MAG: hypothetical protein ACRDOI_16070 [Trebonia sp.]
MRSAPNGPEQEHSTPTVIGDPLAAAPLWLVPDEALAAALADVVPDALLLLPDEQALTDIPKAAIATAATRILRRCTKEIPSTRAPPPWRTYR